MMSETNFTEKVLKAFKNIIKEIEKGSSELEVRRTFDELFLRSVLGYERRDIKWEKKRGDLTIVDGERGVHFKIDFRSKTPSFLMISFLTISASNSPFLIIQNISKS